MALHGSASANLSPILFKGNNTSPGLNIIIHEDPSLTRLALNYGGLFRDGEYVGIIQDILLSKNIGNNVNQYPNLYAEFGVMSKNPTNPFVITNSNGVLNITQSFMRGENSKSLTIERWNNSYINNQTLHQVNICTDIIGFTSGGRLPERWIIDGTFPTARDVHGNLWSIFTTPNAISTGIPGRYGSVISSNVRKGSTTIIITACDDQTIYDINQIPSPRPPSTTLGQDMIDQLVDVSPNNFFFPKKERTINGLNGEMNFRKYRVIAISSYETDLNLDEIHGVLFYGSESPQPYGHVKFTSNSTYSITRSSTLPNWTPDSNRQRHDTLTIAEETRGAVFRYQRIFVDPFVFGVVVDRRVALAKCIAEFIADTV